MTQLVRHLMRPTLITCSPDTTLGEAAARLIQNRVHALIVADNSNQPLGILSDIDLLAGEWLSADATSLKVMRAMTASQLMSTPPTTIDADAPASEAAARIQAERIHRLIVTEGARAIGVISVSDLVASMSQLATERRVVGDVMSRAIVVCLEGTPLAAVARAMTERVSRSVIVVSAIGSPLGIITGLDLLTLYEAGIGKQTVGQIMRTPLTIHPAASLREAADLMLKHHVHRLVVTNPNQPTGVPLGQISTTDIVAEMAEPGSVWQTTGQTE